MNRVELFAMGLVMSWLAAFMLVGCVVAAIVAPFPVYLIIMAFIPPIMLMLAIVVRATIADFNEWRNK